MYEVEVKVPASHDTVRDRLAAIEADPAGSVVQEDTYYDAPHRDFPETDEALRIRRETDADGETEAQLTYKGPLIDTDSKTREEAETAVNDGGELETILESLGFDPVARVRKERDRYDAGEFTVTLDTVEGLGEFVEVETQTTEQNVDAAREEAFSLLERLDLDPADQIRTSYLELLLSE